MNTSVNNDHSPLVLRVLTFMFATLYFDLTGDLSSSMPLFWIRVRVTGAFLNTRVQVNLENIKMA